MLRQSSKHGNRLANEVNRENKWATLLHEYRLHTGAEESLAEPMEKFQRQLLEACQGVDDSSEETLPNAQARLIEVVGEYLGKVAHWRDSCRTGATAHLDAMVGKKLEPLIISELAKPPSPDNMGVLDTLAQVAGLCDQGELQQRVTAALQHRMESSQVMRLTNAVNNGARTFEDIAEFLAAWRAAKNSEGIHGHARDCFLQARPLLMRFLSSELQKPGISLESMDVAYELAKTYMSEAALRNPDDTLAAVDKKT